MLDERLQIEVGRRDASVRFVLSVSGGQRPPITGFGCELCRRLWFDRFRTPDGFGLGMGAVNPELGSS
jgi:hypothetical protein